MARHAIARSVATLHTETETSGAGARRDGIGDDGIAAHHYKLAKSRPDAH